MIKFFPNQKPNEQVLYAIRRHWISYMPHVIFGSAVFIASVLVIIGLLSNLSDFSILTIAGTTIGISMALLSTLFIMLFGFVDHYLDLLIITNERLIDIKQHGFFKQETKEIHLLDIENVNSHVEGPLGVYLKYGHLIIQTGPDEDERIIIRTIPQASKVARALMELHSKHITEPNQPLAIDDQGIEDYGFGGKVESEEICDQRRDKRDKSLSSYWANIDKK